MVVCTHVTMLQRTYTQIGPSTLLKPSGQLPYIRHPQWESNIVMRGKRFKSITLTTRTGIPPDTMKHENRFKQLHLIFGSIIPFSCSVASTSHSNDYLLHQIVYGENGTLRVFLISIVVCIRTFWNVTKLEIPVRNPAPR